MGWHRAIDRAHDASSADYRVSVARLPAHAAAALRRVGDGLRDGAAPDELVSLVERMRGEGEIDEVCYYSALCVIAASPAVADYAEALRLASLQELAAWEHEGADREAHLASVERHRGVVAFLVGRYEIALECFTRAFEKERSGENVANVLAALLRLGDRDEARELLETVRAAFPAPIADEVEAHVRSDRDLAALRD